MGPKPPATVVPKQKPRRGVTKKKKEEQDSPDLASLQQSLSQLQTQMSALVTQQTVPPRSNGPSPSSSSPVLIDLSTPELSTSLKPPSYLCLPSLDNPTLKCLSDRHGFVNLHKLLPINRGIESVPENTMYVPDTDGKLIPTTAPSTRRKIDNFNSWLDAFLLFARFRVYFHADLALALFAYADIIRGLSLSRPLAIWMEYDRRFRDKMSNRDVPDFCWFTEDSTVMAEVLRAIPLHSANPLFRYAVAPAYTSFGKPPFGCYICRDPNHYATVCPQRRHSAELPSASQRNAPAAPLPRDSAAPQRQNQPFRGPRVAVCRDYNAGRCPNPCPSRRLHVCEQCFDPSHIKSFHSIEPPPTYPLRSVVWDFIAGLLNGFSIGYTGPYVARSTPNALTARQYPEIVRRYIAKEIELKHTLGPFLFPPFENFVCSSLGVRPKKTGGARLIMDLSRPFGSSVNDYICKKTYTMRFCSVDDAIRIIVKLGRGALMAKMDLKHAFRLIPVRYEDWHLLGYVFDERYYFDVVLPFGCRSFPAIFDRMATFLEWIIVNVCHFRDVLHYMDDFFFAGPAGSVLCRLAIELMTLVCSDLGIPLALDKTEGPSTTLTFLGVVLDSVNQTISIPPEKLKDLSDEFSVFSARPYSTKRDLLSLIGKLSFATKCIPAGRIFLRRMIDCANSVKLLHQTVTLTTEFRADLNWWITFLLLWNGKASFIEVDWTDAAESLNLFTDASHIGCGGIFGDRWFKLVWPGELLALHPHITWLEMFPILYACRLWGSSLRGKRLTFFTDNQAVAAVWRKFSSKHPGVMALVRALHFEAARSNFHHRIHYLPGRDNFVADALSRDQIERFFCLHPSASPIADELELNFADFLDGLTKPCKCRNRRSKKCSRI
ncbi:uncharacterized protein LOC129585836 [Paramacrobiotus metropolitanus]|uniref:uncharacterized protein LOC129585836 n=1 Tax=Paramacrobiotus metropolitanus TaxID=2943436 RepID=UPI0024465B42|nr:uncharacterized protein LOC129585836 [Paramacrobiotus metropolitanus]